MCAAQAAIAVVIHGGIRPVERQFSYIAQIYSVVHISVDVVSAVVKIVECGIVKCTESNSQNCAYYRGSGVWMIAVRRNRTWNWATYRAVALWRRYRAAPVSLTWSRTLWNAVAISRTLIAVWLITVVMETWIVIWAHRSTVVVRAVLLSVVIAGAITIIYSRTVAVVVAVVIVIAGAGVVARTVAVINSRTVAIVVAAVVIVIAGAAVVARTAAVIYPRTVAVVVIAVVIVIAGTATAVARTVAVVVLQYCRTLLNARTGRLVLKLTRARIVS